MNSAFLVFVTGSVRSHFFLVSHLIVADGSYEFESSLWKINLNRNERGWG